MTRERIALALEALELRGRQVIVHASMEALGGVDGGAETLCGALMDAVGAQGTILMPAFTVDETLPWPGCATPQAPVAFHPELPVSAAIGLVAEAFRRHPGVLRSNHPTHSFSAWGRNARAVLSTQRDNNVLGPLKKLNVMRGDVLLVGMTLRAASVIYLAEEQSGLPYLPRRIAVRINAAGYDERVVLDSVPGCSFAFDRLEARIDPTTVSAVALPHGFARLIPVRSLVQLAGMALAEDPEFFICDRSECGLCLDKRRAIEQFSLARRENAGGR